ncbi:MAG: CoA transferase subunit A [Lentimicrobiaceae bacterium]|nr:CoA transferase subunit A [Lentimicrobiaceae bacterium]MCO5264813.1 CoA transferase subunit A [Lentimicrobium sp.]
MNKLIALEEVVAKIKDGSVIMVGGFMASGTPPRLIDALVKSNVKDLTIICNDTAFPDQGVGRLIVNRQVKKVITSHIGTNPATQAQMNEGTLEVEFVPQGTLAERVRAGGAGLGGFLTPTGLGTMVAEGKQVLTVDGKDFLLEKPLRADIALIGASKGDHEGNLIYNGNSQNFNPLMATATDLVIAEVEKLVETGKICMEHVHTPGIFVDFIINN